MSRRREPVEVTIDNLSHEGRGVGRVDGKTVFVHGALPGERVVARILRRRGRFDEAVAIEVREASPDRIEARCPSYGVCGGCSLQHTGEARQLRHKQDVLLELLQHQAGVRPERVAPPLRGPQFGYRRKARLGVKFVAAKGGVLVGFRERAKPYITDGTRCDILDPRVGERLPALRRVIADLSVAARIPQIEVALGDDSGVLVLRHLEALTEDDRATLRTFENESGLSIFLQGGGPDSVVPLNEAPPALSYRVDDVTIGFEPTDFTQVNAAINADMVRRALDYLAPDTGDRVLDLFCGIGNFTLPIARRAGSVVGIEGDPALVVRGAANARANGIENTTFECADLSDPQALATLDWRSPTKILLDPPRSGAAEVIDAMRDGAVSRLVYVSCNPVTFARDAAHLCADLGFRLAETGILDMFPQTAHVESISLFERR